MRVPLQVVPVLERPDLTFVGVHRHQPRLCCIAHQTPFPARWKASSAKASQATIGKGRYHIVARPLPAKLSRPGIFGSVGVESTPIAVNRNVAVADAISGMIRPE